MRRWLAGNLCRCTGYDKIVRAVLDAADEMAPARAEAAMRPSRSTRQPAWRVCDDPDRIQEQAPAKWTNCREPGRRYRVIGTRPVRQDGTDKVTGRALYGADVRLPGMLYGAVLRSPHAHARILSIDATQALALPGVRPLSPRPICPRWPTR